MDKGQVVEQGSHEELLERKGHYYKLYISQIGSIEEKEAMFNDESEKSSDLDEVTYKSEIVEDDTEEYEYN